MMGRAFGWSVALAALVGVAGCGASDDGGEEGGGPQVCNGHAELCDRHFDEVAFPGTHNSMSSEDDGWAVPNQVHGIARQLEDGIRVFLIDTHEDKGELYLCHSACMLGEIPLGDALGLYEKFLTLHPNELITLIIEDHISAEQTAAAFDASGLTKFAYVHPEGAGFPTLREMIASGKRLLVTAESGGPPPDWYQNAYQSLTWDTPYSFKTPADFSCALNRGKAGNPLFLLNHWLEDPFASQEKSAEANAYELLYGRAKQCWDESGRIPNFVAVNHYSVGELFRVVDALNGL